MPMIWNWIRRDLQLVGVRPLSEHYLSLYPEGLVERRLKHRPGLLPVIYADRPKGIDEIVASEERYLDALETNPLLTQFRYFFKIIASILFQGTRSR